MNSTQSTKLEAYETVQKLANQYQTEGLFTQAEDLYRQAISVARTMQDSIAHRYLIQSLSKLANLYNFQGQEAKAEPLWQEIIDTKSDILSSHDPLFTAAVYQLAELKEKSGELTKAQALYMDLIRKIEKEFGDESFESVPTLKKLAAFHYRQQEYLEAESLYLKILAIEEYHLGSCSEELHYAISALIDIFQKLKKWRLAEHLLHRQHEILTLLHGKNSLCTASCTMRLAELELQTQQKEKAIKNLKAALKTFIRILGTQTNYVIALKNRIDTLEAETKLLSFVPTQTTSVPYNDPYNLVSIGHLHPDNTAARFDQIASH